MNKTCTYLKQIKKKTSTKKNIKKMKYFENYSNQKTQWMCSGVEWRVQVKVSVN